MSGHKQAGGMEMCREKVRFWETQTMTERGRN